MPRFFTSFFLYFSSLFLQEYPLLKDLHSQTNSEALNRLTHLSATEDQEVLQEVVNIVKENNKFE